MTTPNVSPANAQAREAFFGHEKVTVIGPPSGWRMLDLGELWAYRELLWVLATRDVMVRYKQTVLGAAWAVIRPLLTMAIFTVIFGRLAKMPSAGMPYAVFVFAGLLPWMFFSGTVSGAGSSLVGSAHLVSKVYFPRLVIPISALGVPFVDLLVSTVVLFGLMAWYRVPLTWHLALVPLLLVAVAMAALGAGTLLSALTVAYRDFRHLEPFLLQVWMYLTPVIYPVSLFPPRWRWVLYLNPMAGLTEAFRSAFLGLPFDIPGLLVSLAAALLMCVAGVAYFERMERRFADVI